MSRNDRDRLKVLHEVRKRHITHKYKRGRVGHQSALGTGVVAADESTGRPGGARVAGGSIRRLPEAMKARAVKLFLLCRWLTPICLHVGRQISEAA